MPRALPSFLGLVILLVVLRLPSSAAPTGRADTPAPAVPKAALAPEFPAGLQWVNSDHPLRLQDLRGKVVLLDFWTYGCINCLHIIPDLHRLEATYPEDLIVIGVHSAKYDNEAALANIRQAAQRYGITHPVVNDRDLRIWQAYRVPGWPTQIVIDPQGRQLQGFVGENHYEPLNQLIAATVAKHRQQGTLRAGPGPVQVAPPREPATVLRYPGKVLADPASSRLFIADTTHHRIVVTDLQGRLLRVLGRGTAGSEDGPLAVATFRSPQGMALQEEMLYVADTGNDLLRRVDLRLEVVETIAGTGVKAREFNVPGYGRAVALNSPWDLYVHGDLLYIAMAGMHQLWHMNLTTAYLEPFSGSGTEDLVDDLHFDAALGQPSGVSGDGRYVYVADSEVNAVRAASLDPSGAITTLAGGGLFTFGDVDGPGATARLQHPLGVAYAKGTVYIADTYNHKIKALDLRQQRLQTLAGTGTPGWRDGSGAVAQFYEPGGLSIGAGQLYVADTNNHRIRVINLTTHTVSTLPVQAPLPFATTSPLPTDDGKIIQLAEQALQAASPARLHITLYPSTDWKVNRQAPASLALAVTGDGVRLPVTAAKQTLPSLPARLTIPLDVAPAGTQAHLRAELSFVICQVTRQSICALRQVTWEVPVRSQAHNAPSELTLRYQLLSMPDGP